MPIFACAVMEPKRRLKLSWDQRGLPVHEQISIAQTMAVDHYQRSFGEIEFWGVIQGYKFKYAEDQPAATISTAGHIVSEGEVVPAAKSTIGGKDITSFISV